NSIAGGVVVDPYPPRRARPWPPNLDASARLVRFVSEAGGEGVPIAALPVRLGLPVASCRELVAAEQSIVVAAGRVVNREFLEKLVDQALSLVDAYHAEHPLEPGISTQFLRSKLPGAAEVVDFVLNAEASAGTRLATQGGVISRPGWVPTPTADQASLLRTIVSQLEAAGAEPPSIEELASALGADAGAILRFLERKGEVVQVEQNRYYAATQLTSLVERLRKLMSGGVELGPSELRESLGLSRKYLIPFLEYCDRAGYTNRNASGRVWRGT
ncbi:MAG TPA: SelB C-terminal domain-containing protein, partial [Gemmatimonadaceae bacterium]